MHCLCDEHPVHLISPAGTTLSLQPTLHHNSATAFSSSSLCAIYLGQAKQLSPHKVIFSFMISVFFRPYYPILAKTIAIFFIKIERRRNAALTKAQRLFNSMNTISIFCKPIGSYPKTTNDCGSKVITPLALEPFPIWNTTLLCSISMFTDCLSCDGLTAMTSAPLL